MICRRSNRRRRSMIDLPELEINDTGMLVAVLQTLLQWHGYKISSGGLFDIATYEALRDFREQNYLAGDTVTDPETWRKLFFE